MTTHASTSVLESPNQFAEHFRKAIEAAPLRDLDSISKQLSKAYGAGLIADDPAQQLYELIERRRGAQPGARSLATSTPVLTRRYAIQRSPEQRSPDRRVSIRRRRELAASGSLPPNIASSYTVGQQAVLRVLADECLAHGVSDRSRNELAARAGVSLTVVKQAVRYAELDGLITVQRRPRSGKKHLTNIIRIIRVDWLTWLDKGHRKAYAIAACNRAKPDFPLAGGAQKNPPRSQNPGNSNRNRVDKTVKNRNRTGAGRA